jgi:hypothetical protein
MPSPVSPTSLEGFLGGVMARRAAQFALPPPSTAAADIDRAAIRAIAAGRFPSDFIERRKVAQRA